MDKATVDDYIVVQIREFAEKHIPGGQSYLYHHEATKREALDLLAHLITVISEESED